MFCLYHDPPEGWPDADHVRGLVPAAAHFPGRPPVTYEEVAQRVLELLVTHRVQLRQGEAQASQPLAVRTMPKTIPYAQAGQDSGASKADQDQQRPGLGGFGRQVRRRLRQGDREREGDGCRTQKVRGATRPPSDLASSSGRWRHCPPAGAETVGFGAGC